MELEYENERLEGIPCGNRLCFWGFDEKYEQNCALAINNGPFCIVCDQYSPELTLEDYALQLKTEG